MKYPVSRTLVPAVLLCAAASAWAQAQNEPKKTETFTNLKVLPQDMPPDQLRAFMSSISRALGVHCDFCHAIEEGKPHTNADFAKDDKPTKITARAMMQMTQDINDKYLANLPSREEQPIRVQCVTCHHGTTEPRTLQDVLVAAYGQGGVDTTVARYQKLRDKYYGRFTYDFGDAPLTDVARQLVQSGHSEDAARLFALNVEMNPKSPSAKRAYANTAILAAFRDAGPDSGKATYARFKSEYGENVVTEQMVNDIGYQLLSAGNAKAALPVFQLNVAEHPQSGDAYDSLGEGYAAAGDRKKAKEAYEKSLKLDPSNDNAKQKLAELKKGKKAKKS
ncbi:MAG TPA: c-type cytochrome [Dongiaceae bacterium]|nr:c-type cytochrome [Dongiaceae bacterium]